MLTDRDWPIGPRYPAGAVALSGPGGDRRQSAPLAPPGPNTAMICTRCPDCLPGPARGLRCRFSGAEVTHDCDLEATCPRNLSLLDEDGRCVARTVLAVTLLLDPRGALLELLLSRYPEWTADRLRGLLRGKALATAVHGDREEDEIDTPARWEGRFGAWAGERERAEA